MYASSPASPSDTSESCGEQLLRLDRKQAGRPQTRPLGPERREVGAVSDDDESDAEEFQSWLEEALGRDVATQTVTQTRRGSVDGKQGEIQLASLREQIKAKDRDMEFVNSQNQVPLGPLLACWRSHMSHQCLDEFTESFSPC